MIKDIVLTKNNELMVTIAKTLTLSGKLFQLETEVYPKLSEYWKIRLATNPK